MPLALFALSIVIQLVFAGRLSARVAEIVRGVERAEPALAQLAQLLQLIEVRQFRSPRLTAIETSIRTGGRTASAEIERLRKLVGLLDARRNQFFAPIGALLMWT
jgi:hypothetical protein